MKNAVIPAKPACRQAGPASRSMFWTPTFVGVTLLMSSMVFAASPKVLLSTTTLLPGETLRVEVDDLAPDVRGRIAFMGKFYPLFEVGPDARRALIGIRLDAVPGIYPLIFAKAPTSAPSDLPSEPFQIEIATRTFTIENVNFAEEKSALMLSEHRESVLIHRKNQFLSRDQQWEGVFMYPVEGQIIGEFALKRTRNGTIDAGFHKGIDLRAAKGTPVLAANTGTVVLAQTLKAHGKTVMINHGQGVMTIYLHMQSLSVKDRQKVHKGQEIGKVGSTGLSTAPHVHFQVFVHGVPVDPKPWVETEF
jgi:murein DD-endopeptidase MepM/ murein hydrolase activator NlpD